MHCETHNYHTRHKTETYAQHCKLLKDALLSKLPDLDIRINVVPPSLQDRFYSPEDPKWQSNKPIGRFRFPRVGAFEVVIRGRIVFSKLESGKWPQHSLVADWVKQVIEGLEPETRPVRPVTRDVKSRKNRRYKEDTTKSAAPGLQGSSSQGHFPQPQYRERTPSPPQQVPEPQRDSHPPRDLYQPSVPPKPSRYEDSGSYHHEEPAVPAHTDPPVSVHKGENLPPPHSAEYADDFSPPQPENSHLDPDFTEKTASKGREIRGDEEDFDALVPETDITDEMNFELPVNYTMSQTLEHENHSDKTQNVTLRSSNPAIVWVGDAVHTVQPAEKEALVLNLAASEVPGVKQCVLYLTVDGKVTDCILVNIHYKEMEDMQVPAGQEEEQEDIDVFSFEIPLNKKVKKVRNRQKITYVNGSEGDQQVEFVTIRPDLLKVKPKSVELRAGESVKVRLVFKPVSESGAETLLVKTVVNGEEGQVYQFEVTYAN